MTTIAAEPPHAQPLEALEARVRELHAQATQFMKEGREEQAKAAYTDMQANSDAALEVAMAQATPALLPPSVEHAARFPSYCSQAPLRPWSSSSTDGTLRARAAGAVLGAAVADAAACSVQWLYDLPQLAALAEGREGLEFFDPPQCPFFEYPLGRASPYGQQTAVLLASLVQQRGLDCCAYAAALYDAFGPGFGGYRDGSTRTFLRRHAAGHLPPLTGAPDEQANCFTRLPPLVAAYAGDPRLAELAECMIRTTQDDDVAVANGVAAACMLEAVMQGASVAAAVQHTVAWLQRRASNEGGGGRVNGGAAAVPAERWAAVAAGLQEVAGMAALPPPQVTAQLGRNCHLPGSLQTAVHVALHVEAALAGSALAAIDAEPAQAAAVAARQEGGPAEGSCIPCSLGAGNGAACPPPSNTPAPLELPPDSWQQQQPASLPAGAYTQAVRLALREGGCCASRATFTGALIGALTGAAGIPQDWERRVEGWEQQHQLVDQLLALRTIAGRLTSGCLT